jgi:micrococcal nuclease
MKDLRRAAAALAALLCLTGCGNQYSAADIQSLWDQAYQSGYDAGVSTGQADGYAQGKESGYAEGHDAGYAEGYDLGYTEGLGAIGDNSELTEDPEEDPAEPTTSVQSAKQTSADSSNAASVSSDSSSTDSSNVGYSDSTTVYVSKSGKKIHLKSDCSGMKNYTTMTLAEADANGYARCSRCFS